MSNIDLFFCFVEGEGVEKFFVGEEICFVVIICDLKGEVCYSVVDCVIV